MIKLVLCDMDGTLKPFGVDTVSERSIRAIHRLRDAGIQFGPATGREPVDLRSFFRGDESCYQTGIMANGKIVDVDGERVLSKPLDHAALVRLEAFCQGRDDLSIIVYAPATDADGNPTTRIQVCGATQEEVDAYVERTGITLADGGTIGPVPDATIMTAGVACIGEAPDVEALHDELAREFPEFDFVRPAPTFFDVLPRGWNKADALGVLVRYLGIKPEEVAFFGDSENDLAMLRAVPNSFAVGNGTDEAKAAAARVIGDAADDSVAQEMEKIAATGEA